MNNAINYHEKEAYTFKSKYLNKESFRSRLIFWQRIISRFKGLEVSLDLGCGPGWMTKELAIVSDKVVAVDGSKGMIDHAKATVGPELIDKIDFRELEINENLWLSLKDLKFDLILSSSVLEYIDGAEEVLFSAYSSLKPNGHLVFSIPNRDSWLRVLESFTFKLFGIPAYRKLILNSWTKNDCFNILEAIGYTIKEVYFQGTVPFYSTMFFWLNENKRCPFIVIMASKNQQL